LPYDRPVLSKNLTKASDMEDLFLRKEEFFEEHGIEVMLSSTVKEVDADSQEVIFLSGRPSLKYDKVLIATGATPRKLTCPGAQSKNVFTLRVPEDSLNIAEACTRGKKVVVVGSSFIGMEIAATMCRRGCQVSVIGMESVPFERVLGKRIGQSVKTFFESKGIAFIGNEVVEEMKTNGDLANTVVLKGGTALPCDAVVVGAGVIPNATFVKGVGKGPDGSIITDKFMKSPNGSLYAAGDVATYARESGPPLRVEHWQVACTQGRVAAWNMCGNKKPYDDVPFFWTSLFGKNLRYVGNCKKYNELVIEGDLEKMDFVAYYCNNGEIEAVSTMARDPVAIAACELMRLGKMPSANDIKEGRSHGSNLVDRLKALNRKGA